jgi:uncharacterized protein YggT (Ycf19 family)
MAEQVQHIRHWRRDPNNTAVETSEVINRENPAAEQARSQDVASRIVWYVAGILLALLALRFMLALLGANPANAFANLVYSITYPFVAPFFTLFSYNLSYSRAHFELYTLVAMLVYALMAYGISRLITLTREDEAY